MALRTVFTKQLAAAGSTNICTSQSGSAGVPLVLNGSTTHYLSTTTTAAAAAGTSVLTLTSVTGLVVGQPVSDTTANVIPAGTTIVGISSAAKTVTLSTPIGGAGVGSGDTIVFTSAATIDTATAANSAIGRRVVLAYTGTDTSFTIVGTNAAGNTITDVAVGSSGAAQSNLDFVTVSSLTPVGGGLTALTAGTNGVGSSPWVSFNWRGYAPMSIGVGIELVSGSVNFTLQYTYDDPNNLEGGALFPLAFNSSVIVGASATIDGVLPNSVNGACTAGRVLINSGTGELRVRFVQAGAG